MKNEINVSMLPTKDKDMFDGRNCLYVSGTQKPDKMYYLKPSIGFDYPQHIYITRTQVATIKEGDWAIYKDGFDSSLFKVTKVDKDGRVFEGMIAYPSHKCRKIIATTDTKLTVIKRYESKLNPKGYKEQKETLPQVPKSFLKQLATNPNSKWEIEYEEYSIQPYFGNKKQYHSFRVKINQYNEVDITYVEDKIYSRKEVEHIVSDFALYCTKNDDNAYKHLNWIKENL